MYNNDIMMQDNHQNRDLHIKILAQRGDDKEFKIMQDAINQIQQAKQQFKEDRSNQSQTNQDNITKLNETIEKLKNYYIQQIDQILFSIQQWSQQVQNIEKDLINKVQQKEAYDYKSFLRYIKEEENSIKLIYSSFQKNVNSLFQSLDKPQLLSKQYLKKSIKMKKYKQESLQYNRIQIFYVHQEKIILFDLSQEAIISKRVACQYCLDSYSSLHYKSVKFVQDKWRIISQNRFNHANLFKNKIKSVSDYFENLKQDLIKILDNANKISYNHYDEYSFKLDSIKNKMNQSWSEMSKDEIIKVILELSNLNNQTSSLDPLLNEYIYQDNQIKEIVKNTSLHLQECQGSQFNKINELINNQIMMDDIQSKEKESYKVVKYQNIIEKIDQSQTTPIVQATNQKQFDLSIPRKRLNREISLHTNQNIQQKFKSQKPQINPFTYNLLQNKSIKQNEWCGAIAFNRDNSIVVAGCSSQIKVFEYKQECLKQTQLLSEHSGDVYSLNFMKKSSQFISGSFDTSIIIWCQNENNQWICKQKLNGHKSFIRCLIINNNEEIIISGSVDNTIKFWMKENEWKYAQTITDHTNTILGLSMNDSQNKVISYGWDKLILIIEYSLQDQKWNVIQKITVEYQGMRICFTNDDVFTFQPFCKNQMHVYEMNSTNKQYSKAKEIIVQCGNSNDYCFFPQQYIQQKYLVVNKNGQYVNLIRKKENGDFITQQSINFQTYDIYGCMSDQGDYLITWDNKVREIQIRKYIEK